MASTQTIAVLNESELQDGQMKEVEFGEGKVLLSKIGGSIHATSAFCTHYGAPLAKGVLVASGRVTCPWHGACFNVCTGDIEDAPGPAALHSFEASVKDGKIYVTAEPSKTKSDNKSRPPATTNRISKPAQGGVVIVGGGSGALGTVIGLREAGYRGGITIVSREPYAPIDRTKLSKALVTDASKLELYSESSLRETFGVELLASSTVSGIDTMKKTVSLEGSNEKIAYEKLVLATGSTPKRLPIPGNDLPHVFVLRTVEDAKKIDAALGEGKSLVVVGSSFIGMEAVVAVKERKLKAIHVVGNSQYPFQAVLGEKIGAGLRKFHEGNGVKFHGESKVTGITRSGVTFESKEGKETTVEADIVVMAVGVGPATEYLKGSGISTRKDGGVEVDEFLKVKGVQDVYAIGDIAAFPEPTTGELARIEHWNVAQNHGRAVASGIAGNPLPFDKVPIFWSAQGQQLRYAGYGVGYDDVFIKGDPNEMKFVAYYIKGDKVVAISSMQADPIVAKASELIRLGQMPTATEIKGGKDILTIDISSSASDVHR